MLENKTPGSIEVKLNAASYSGRMVVLRKDTNVSEHPVDGIFYTQNLSFGVGSDLGGESFVVYDGLDTAIQISNLENGNYYHAAVYEYNANDPEKSVINYLTSEYVYDSIFIKNTQLLEWTGPMEFLTDFNSFPVQVNASSTLPVEVELVSGPLSFSDGLATINGPGECIFHVTQNGDDQYFGIDSLFTITILNLTAIGDDPENHIQVYPNPFTDQLSISFPDNVRYSSMKITDFQGKVMLNKNISDQIHQVEINLPLLKKGVYLLELHGNSTVRKKLIH